MARREKSQQLWTEGEALERAGRATEAIGLFVQAALAEEQDRQWLRARLLWERIAERTGPTGTVLERLAAASAGAKLFDDAYDYWRASARLYAGEGRSADAARAEEQTRQLESKVEPHEMGALAAKVLGA